MTDTELAYAAGIIDGEGCIGIYKRNALNRTAGGDGRRTYRTMITVAMCEPTIVEFLYRIFGGCQSRIRASGPKSRPQFSWTIAAVQAGRCAELLLPFLRLKNRQALNLIELQLINKTIRDSTTEQRKQRNGLRCWTGSYEIDPRLLARSAELHASQRELNLRGVGKSASPIDPSLWKGSPRTSAEDKRLNRKAWSKRAYQKKKASMTAEELEARRTASRAWWKTNQQAALAGDPQAKAQKQRRLQRRRERGY
jgi:hypothetical protein